MTIHETPQTTTPARRPPAIYLLVVLLVFQGLSGLVGGIGLTGDPTGGALGFDPAWLEGSPFGSYLVPGLVLLVLLGVGPLVAAGGVLRRARWAWPASLATGAALLVWIGVEIAVVGYIPAPPLQLVYGLVGAGIVAAAAVPGARRYLRGSHSTARISPSK